MKTILAGLFAVALWAQYVPPGGGGGAPSGAAGGSLAGTYPNPTIGTLGQNLLFTDATYDIGGSSSTFRPRDIFTSRDVTVGRNFAVGTSLSVAGPLGQLSALAHNAMGPLGTVDADDLDGDSSFSILTFAETFTAYTKDNATAIQGNIIANPSANHPNANTFGDAYDVWSDAANTHQVGSLTGAFRFAAHFGSGDAQSIRGATFYAHNRNNANVTNDIAGVYANVQNRGTGSVPLLVGYWGEMYDLGASSVALQATYYAVTPATFGGGAVIGRNMAFYNQNFTGVAGAGKDFAWYSEGGTNHLETGEAATIGIEIEAFAGQTANLFQTLASDGTTVTSKIDSSLRATYPLFGTMTKCANAASPAVCAAAPAGAVAIPTGITTVSLVVNTTAVTASSQIKLQADDSLTIAATTCNNTLATLVGGLAVTARTPGTSFTITYNGTIATNPLCVAYSIIN